MTADTRSRATGQWGKTSHGREWGHAPGLRVEWILRCESSVDHLTRLQIFGVERVALGVKCGRDAMSAS